MRQVNNRLEISPINDGIKLIFFDCLRISMSFQSELSISSHCYCLITWCCTVVLLYRISVLLLALYCCITSSPVYPSTIHGQGIVVLNTSNQYTALHYTEGTYGVLHLLLTPATNRKHALRILGNLATTKLIILQ
jgi:hypothetical protein